MCSQTADLAILVNTQGPHVLMPDCHRRRWAYGRELTSVPARRKQRQHATQPSLQQNCISARQPQSGSAHLCQLLFYEQLLLLSTEQRLVESLQLLLETLWGRPCTAGC